MKSPKVDNSGQERAAAAAAQAQAAANNLQKNFATDLKTDNMTEIIAAGTAADQVTTTDSAVRKRNRSTGLSSQLGLTI